MAVTGDRVRLSFRPHSLRLQKAAAAAPPDDTRMIWLPGRIESGEFLGGFMRWRVRVGARSLLVDQPHRAGEPRPVPGSEVQLGLDLSQARVFGA